MKRIRFTADALYENEGYQKGTLYKKGSTHDFEDHFADRWLRRELAVEVNSRKPLPDDAVAEEDAPEGEQELPALGAMNKAELQAQAAAEGVDLAVDATNAEIRSAIEAARGETAHD